MNKRVVFYSIACLICFLSGCDFQNIQRDLELATHKALNEISNEIGQSSLTAGLIYHLPCCHGLSNHEKIHSIRRKDGISIEKRDGKHYCIKIEYMGSYKEFGQLFPPTDQIWVDLNSEGRIVHVTRIGAPDKLVSKIEEYYQAMRGSRRAAATEPVNNAAAQELFNLAIAFLVVGAVLIILFWIYVDFRKDEKSWEAAAKEMPGLASRTEEEDKPAKEEEEPVATEQEPAKEEAQVLDKDRADCCAEEANTSDKENKMNSENRNETLVGEIGTLHVTDKRIYGTVCRDTDLGKGLSVDINVPLGRITGVAMATFNNKKLRLLMLVCSIVVPLLSLGIGLALLHETDSASFFVLHMLSGDLQFINGMGWIMVVIGILSSFYYPHVQSTLGAKLPKDGIRISITIDGADYYIQFGPSEFETAWEKYKMIKDAKDKYGNLADA